MVQAKKVNKTLNDIPPSIADEERNLERESRILAKLRAGYSRMLNSYQNRLDQDVKDECPNCKESPHDSQHLFNCKKEANESRRNSLLTDPVAPAAFLGI